MDKEFIPHQQALELKELGFDEVCMGGYDLEDNSLYIGYVSNDGIQYNPEYYTPAPLYQQAFRWFREKKLSDSSVCRYQEKDDGGIYFFYGIDNNSGVEERKYFKEGFHTYKSAELACLKKLIEIIKTK